MSGKPDSRINELYNILTDEDKATISKMKQNGNTTQQISQFLKGVHYPAAVCGAALKFLNSTLTSTNELSGTPVESTTVIDVETELSGTPVESTLPEIAEADSEEELSPTNVVLPIGATAKAHAPLRRMEAIGGEFETNTQDDEFDAALEEKMAEKSVSLAGEEKSSDLMFGSETSSE